LDPPRLVDAGLRPFHRRERNAELVHEIPAAVNRRGLRPLRNADALAPQVAWRLHRAARAHVDRRQAEHARRKDRERDDARVVLRSERDVLREGQLGDVPLAELREAEEDLLDREVSQTSSMPSGRTTPCATSRVWS